MARFKKDFDWSQIERDNQPDEEIIYVSKSEIKRDAKYYRDLAAEIVDLSLQKIESLGFDTKLVDSIKLARSLNLDAKRRQINFISKQLRSYDMDALERLVKESNPTVHKTKNVQLDKQITVTIDRILNPSFTDKTLDLLAQQFADFDREYVAQQVKLLQEQGLSTSSDLYNYFFELYRAKFNA